MKITSIIVKENGKVAIEPNPTPSKEWLKDGVYRWVNIEGLLPEQFDTLFTKLGFEGSGITDHIKGENWQNVYEEEFAFAYVFPTPTSWVERDSWFHLIALPETVITLHHNKNSSTDSFINTWWLKRPGPEQSGDALILHVIQCFVEEEYRHFIWTRQQIEKHAEGLRIQDDSIKVDDLEVLMTDCNHMATIFFDYQLFFLGSEFGKSRVLVLTDNKDLFRQAANTIQTMREGVEVLQRRLAELQQQHLMDQQQKTDSRLRLLTIISAIFLPLTLIAGIYGMNFRNMPELQSDYSYFVVLGIMGVVGIGMTTFFVKRGWLK